jgi:uncharacterized protein YqgC (DUF456 family)
MENFLNISIFALVQIFMLVGLFGLIVPVFPGLVVMWLAALGYGVASGFSTLGIVLFVIITVLMLAGSLGDNLLMGMGARKGGASWVTIAVALVAGVIGTLLLPPIGGLIAAPAAVLLLEYQRLGDWQKAMAALRGLATGWGLSFVVRFLLGVIIQLLWWLWVWQG